MKTELIKITISVIKKIIQIFKSCVISIIICFVRLIKPIIFIRFGPIRSDVIGHNVFDVEYYLSEKELFKNNSIDFFYFEPNNPPNHQWSLMIQRHLRVNPFFRHLDKTNLLIPGGKKHHMITHIQPNRDIKGYLFNTKPHINFTSDENNRGRHFLENLGVKPFQKFVCLIVRDSTYKDKYQPGRDWSYHSYRNSNIDSYEKTILALQKKGYWVFRMGKGVVGSLKIKIPRVLDYANSQFRSDFLDIWLMANCFFCISTCTGLDEVARAFRRPAVYVNFLCMEDFVTYDHVLTFPKHLIWKDTNEKLFLSEHLQHSYFTSKQYENADIVIKNLTGEEILGAVLEMEARLNGTWKESLNDKRQQQLLWKILNTWPDYNKYHDVIHPEARISSYFLRENPKWLN